LLDKNLDWFRKDDAEGNPCPNDTIAKMRMDNYEKRRRNKMRIIV